MFPFSVIIPVFNAASHLESCLQSILASLPGEAAAEVILVDDGSVDKSLTVCRRFEAQYPCIHVIPKTHGGVASARNAGLEAARGEYIAWVDADDCVARNWYPAIHRAIESFEPDIIVMDTLRFDRCAETPEAYGRPGGFIPRDIFLADLYRDIRMLSGLPNKVMKATLFSGVRFDKTLPLLEDFAAMPSILRNVQTVYHIPECLYRYRQHEESLLHQVTPERAYLSFEIAVNRAAEIPGMYRTAAKTAAAIQAHRFCSGRFLHPGFRSCIRYVRRVLPSICADPEVPGKWKLKLLLLALGIARPARKPPQQ